MRRMIVTTVRTQPVRRADAEKAILATEPSVAVPATAKLATANLPTRSTHLCSDRRRKLTPLADRGPLRVMFVITSMPVGGAETLLVELVRRMDRGRFLPELCCLKYFDPVGRGAGPRDSGVHRAAGPQVRRRACSGG